MSALPLGFRRILVTRAAHQAGKLSEGLRELGATPVEVPVLDIVFLDSLDQYLRDIGRYDWILFTSANTVRAVEARGNAIGISPAFTTTAKVAAVGSATAATAKDAGWQVAFVPESYVAESLATGLQRSGIQGKQVLLARAEVTRDVIPDALRAAGAIVDVVDAYRNVIPQDAPERLCRALAEGVDAATFTSSSTVSHLADAARAAGVRFPLEGVPAVSIGPITSATLREMGWEPSAEADPHDIAGLIAAVANVLRQ